MGPLGPRFLAGGPSSPLTSSFGPFARRWPVLPSTLLSYISLLSQQLGFLIMKAWYLHAHLPLILLVLTLLTISHNQKYNEHTKSAILAVLMSLYYNSVLIKQMVCTRFPMSTSANWKIWLMCFMLDKDSPELKVLAVTINSKLEQAFECSTEQSSSSLRLKLFETVWND